MKASGQRPVCSSCKHAYVTWDPTHPYGCRAYSFRSQRPASEVVRQSSGLDCQLYELRPPARRAEGARRPRH